MCLKKNEYKIGKLEFIEVSFVPACWLGAEGKECKVLEVADEWENWYNNKY